MQKASQRECRIENWLRENLINYISSGKATTILLIVGLIKNISLYKMSYFLNHVFVIPSKSKIKVETDLSNYATKSDFKNATGADTSKIAKKLYLASLKSEIDRLDIDKLEKVPIDFNIFKSKADKLDVDNLVPVN